MCWSSRNCKALPNQHKSTEADISTSTMSFFGAFLSMKDRRRPARPVKKRKQWSAAEPVKNVEELWYIAQYQNAKATSPCLGDPIFTLSTYHTLSQASTPPKHDIPFHVSPSAKHPLIRQFPVNGNITQLNFQRNQKFRLPTISFKLSSRHNQQEVNHARHWTLVNYLVIVEWLLF